MAKNKEKSKIEILVGRRIIVPIANMCFSATNYRYIDDAPEFIQKLAPCFQGLKWENNFALVVEDKVIRASRLAYGKDFEHKTQRAICETVGEEFGDLVATEFHEETGLYRIVNGLRIKEKTDERVPCLKMSNYGIKIFRGRLNQKIGIY